MLLCSHQPNPNLLQSRKTLKTRYHQPNNSPVIILIGKLPIPNLKLLRVGSLLNNRQLPSSRLILNSRHPHRLCLHSSHRCTNNRRSNLNVHPLRLRINHLSRLLLQASSIACQEGVCSHCGLSSRFEFLNNQQTCFAVHAQLAVTKI